MGSGCRPTCGFWTYRRGSVAGSATPVAAWPCRSGGPTEDGSPQVQPRAKSLQYVVRLSWIKHMKHSLNYRFVNPVRSWLEAVGLLVLVAAVPPCGYFLFSL